MMPGRPVALVLQHERPGYYVPFRGRPFRAGVVEFRSGTHTGSDGPKESSSPLLTVEPSSIFLPGQNDFQAQERFRDALDAPDASRPFELPGFTTEANVVDATNAALRVSPRAWLSAMRSSHICLCRSPLEVPGRLENKPRQTHA